MTPPGIAGPSPPRRIAFVNEKGGSCKTTLAVNTAAFLAGRQGHRVLLCDLDAQGQSGKSLGLDVAATSPTMFEVLADDAVPVHAAIRPTSVPGLDVIVANKRLADVALRLAADVDRDRRLRRRLHAVSGYDFVVFDAPPSPGLLVRNILSATTEVVIPVPLTYLAADGCAEVLGSVDEARERSGNGAPEVTLIVPTFYRRTNLADELLERIRTHFPDLVAKTVVGYCVKIDEAQSHGQTIWDYAPQSAGARMLEQFALEVIARRPGAPAPGIGPPSD